jgi:hypothetical protein
MCQRRKRIAAPPATANSSLEFLPARIIRFPLGRACGEFICGRLPPRPRGKTIGRTILYDASAVNHIDQKDNDGNHQKDVNEATDRVRTDHPEQPEDEQYDENGPEHDFFLS